MSKKQYTLKELADFLSLNFRGDPACPVSGIGSLGSATSSQISFLSSARFAKYLKNTQAAIVIIDQKHLSQVAADKNVIIADDPYLAYAKISVLFDNTKNPQPGIHPTAIIGDNCEIGKGVSIGPYCVIGDMVNVGDGVIINSGCIIADHVVIGSKSKLCANVVLYHRVKIGKRNLLHSGVVIGSDGFGNANDKGVWCKIHQLGSVIIGDDVEIGANTTIDRGAIEDTVIEDGVRLDNQIQIGHNVHIGAHTAIAGCVGIAGSTRIGRYCMIGGHVGINGHIEITDGVIIGGKSAIAKSITKSGVYSSGIPALEHRNWAKILVRLNQLENIVSRVNELEKNKI